ncbi:putative serine esterase-domain-containing protein, partial [Zopfochytrium polystomum]
AAAAAAAAAAARHHPPPPRARPVHLFVLQNGLWGNPGHLSWLADQITAHDDRQRAARGNEASSSFADSDSSPRSLPLLPVETLNSTANKWIRTYDGIDDCGARLARLIISRIQDEQKPPVAQISFIGYSLGGLIVRYAIGVLWANGLLR